MNNATHNGEKHGETGQIAGELQKMKRETKNSGSGIECEK